MMDIVIKAAGYIPLIVIGLLPIMNPLSTIPLFLGLTSNMSAKEKKRQARRACTYAFLILATFLLFGHAIIKLFGISLEGIRVAGGLIILVLAFRMLFSGASEADTIEDKPAEIKRAELDFSFSPLAMPSLAGPGSIAVVMAYGSQVPHGYALIGYSTVLIGILITAVIAWLALLGSSAISRSLGKHGIHAVTKIMGFLLTCVAVQFIASGIRGFVLSFPQ